MDDMNVDIGRALLAARKRRGWTQAEAARALDTHPTQLTRYESGAREAPLSFLRRAEEAYGTVIVTPHGVGRGTPTTPTESMGTIRTASLATMPPADLHVSTALWVVETWNQELAAMNQAVATVTRQIRAAIGGEGTPPRLEPSDR